MFQICQFSKKLLQYCITIRGKQRDQLSHGKVCCRENQETSQTVVMDFWWLTESPDEVQTFDSQKFQGGEDLLRHI